MVANNSHNKHGPNRREWWQTIATTSMGQIGANGGKQKSKEKSRRRKGASPVGQIGANGGK